MALDLTTRYPGQVEPGLPEYPQGKARNIVSEGDGTGTPFERDLVNDWLGFQQALLKSAGVTPSGTPDTALASQYLTSFYRLLGRVDGWGALGDDASDDTAAIQAAITALSTAAGSGRRTLHFADGKIYRHTGLTVPSNIELDLHGAMLKVTHATNAQLTFTGSGGPFPQRVMNARFGASVASSGITISLPNSNYTVRAIGCHFGATANTNGKFVVATGAIFSAQKCTFSGRADETMVEATGLARVLLEECEFNVPATYTKSVVKLSGASASYLEMAHPTFNLGTRSAGSAVCVEIAGTNKRALILGAEFAASNDQAAFCTAFKWDGAIRIEESGSDFGGTGKVKPYDGPTLAEGSRLGLRPHGRDTASGAFVIPSDFATFSLSLSLPGPLTMPAIRYPGQELALDIYNNSAAPWESSFVPMDALGPGIADKDPAGQFTGLHIKTALFRVVYSHFLAEYRWTMVGDWSIRVPRAQTVGA